MKPGLLPAPFLNFMVKLQVAPKASEAIDSLMASGMDHHLLVKEGDYIEMMTLLCKYMGVKKVTF